jgi:DNA polymerase I-like protein with 3'-5' exonuclease and polymerase domains
MVIAADVETPTAQWNDAPFLMSYAHKAATGELVSGVYEVNDEYVEAQTLLESASSLVFHNAKFDLQKLVLSGLLVRDTISPERIEDTEALAHLLDEHQVKKLKPLAEKYLGVTTDEAEALREAKKVVAKELKIKMSEVTYDQLPREIVIPYAIKDAEFTLGLWEKLKPELDRHADLAQLYRDEMVLTLVLLDMEAQTMKLDLEYLEARAKEYATQALLKELEIRDIVGDEDFNPNSPKQILEAFASLGVELKATDKAALRDVDHPLSAAILELRRLRKIHGTYLLGLLHEQRDGYVHLNFRQHGPKTGRMASGGREA